MTLQLRLSLIYAALSVAAIAVLGVAAYIIASNRLHTNQDNSLKVEAQAVEATLGRFGNITPDVINQARFALDREIVQGAVFQIMAPDGTVLYSSQASSEPLPDTSPGPPQLGLRNLNTPDGQMRSIVRPIERTGLIVGYIESRASLSFVDGSLNDIRALLVVGGILVALATSVACYYVAGRAVAPVRRVADLAREIERTADFTRRLPPSRSTVEMEELVRTFNRMIDRVERLIGTQRSFLSDTSHELRRPLTIMRTNIEVINDPALGEDERATVEREMREAGESMTTLLRELLVLARSDEQPARFEPIDLSELCDTAIRHARETWRDRCFEAEVAPDVVVSGDEQALSRLLDNLLQNAATYSDTATTVLLRVERNRHDVRLEVRDQGAGMSEEDVVHAFDRFYRSPTARRERPDGLGLGLAIVKQVVDAHGGSISIDSQPGEGTSVVVTLPEAQTVSSA